MSGFFFAFVFFAGEMMFASKRTRIGSWLVGSVLGTLPMLPWISYVASTPSGHALQGWREVLKLRFFGHWFSEPLGADLGYRLGPRSSIDFLHWPLVALSHLAIGLITLAILWNGLRGFKRVQTTETWRAVAMAFISGVLMSVVSLRVHKHYLMVAFPLPTVFFCAVALWNKERGPRLLAGMWVAQLALTVSFLVFVHEGKNDPKEEYGVPYRRQSPVDPSSIERI